jgi:DNA-binding transcriptional MerR regulator
MTDKPLDDYNPAVIELNERCQPPRGADIMMFTIREMAAKVHVHEQTLRNWERTGLLKVSRIGRNRTRIYNEEDLVVCRKIAEFSDRGINLQGIKALLTRDRKDNRSKVNV